MFRHVPECSMFQVLSTPLSTPSTSQSTPCWNWNRKSRFNALSTCEWQLYPQGSLGATLIGTMVNFKRSGFDKGTGGKSGKFQFDCDGRLSKTSFVGFHMARDEGIFILDWRQFYRPKNRSVCLEWKFKRITLLDDKDATFHLDRKKQIFPRIYRESIVTFLAWRYNSSETTGSSSSKYEHRRQTALLRNIEI